MINQTNHKIIASILFIIFIPSMFIPFNTWALTTGPSQPEYTAFEPVDAKDMVNLLTGDLTYTLPLLNVPGPEGGYPLALSYHAGITLEQEASWVGLGWSLNPGAINRFVNGYPDDWKAKTVDDITYQSPSITEDYGISLGIGIANTYTGISAQWGTYKSFGGSIDFGMGFKDSPYSAGASVGTEGIGLNMGLGPKQSKIGFGIGGGIFMDYHNNFSGYLGVSVSDGGIRKKNGKAYTHSMGSIGISFSSSGAQVTSTIGAYSVSSKGAIHQNAWSGSWGGIFIPVYQGPVYASFSYNHYRTWLYHSRNKKVWGPLYFNNGKVLAESWGLQESGHVMDSYVNPYNANKFDDLTSNEKSNSLSFPNYDSYVVAAQGVGGSMTPRILELGTLVRNGKKLSYHTGGWPPKTEIQYNNKYDFDQPHHQVYFRFDNEHSSYYLNEPDQLDYTNGGDPLFDTEYRNFNVVEQNRHGNSNYNATTKRLGSGKHVEWFSNSDIVNDFTNARQRGFIECNPGFHTDRSNADLVDPDGIGAFTVTTEDGKTYHFAQPVYQFEEIVRQELKSQPDSAYLEQRKLDKYAFTWLLTAITGPDFIDRNHDGYIDNNDWGYWVKFNYGKWTDGYIWRNPFSGYADDLAGSAYGTYAFGRKQVYYLNSIETRTHQAYFIKDLREDGKGKTLSIQEDYESRVRGLYGPEYNFHIKNINVGTQHRLLQLSKIIILNKGDISIDPAYSSNFITAQTGTINFSKRTKSYNNIGQLIGNTTTQLYHKAFDIYLPDNILEVKDIQADLSAIEAKAVKIIELDYFYHLSKNTPNSSGSGGGKLTLRNVHQFGRQKQSLMPPYSFRYYNEAGYQQDEADHWGYYGNERDYLKKPLAHNWSLKEIITPIGGQIQITYESDSYAKEAVFNANDANIDIITSVTKSTGNPDHLILEFQPLHDISEWFTAGQAYFFYYKYYDNPLALSTSTFKADLPIVAVDPANHRITLDYQGKAPFSHWNPGQSNLFRVETHLTARNIIAYGGGIRVKSLETFDPVTGRSYETRYNYTNPVSGITSGTTSFAPGKGSRFIPYLFELPSPGVLYEFVTTEQIGDNGSSLGQTRYQFETIQPAADIHDYEFRMGDQFQVSDINHDITSPSGVFKDPANNRTDQVFTRSSVVHNQFSSIGRLLAVQIIDAQGIVVGDKFYEYYDKNDLDAGIIQEAYNDFRRYIQYGQNPASSDSWWYATSSSRKMYPNVLKKIISQSDALVSEISYDQFDFNTGQVLTSTSTDSWGRQFQTINIPAYHIYDGMGSKSNANNAAQTADYANMLSQLGASYVKNGSKMVKAAIQTWDNNWTYREFNGSNFSDQTMSDVWRKQKVYAWKSDLNEDGTFKDNQFVNFRWMDHSTSESEGWQRLKEVVRYDHYSRPLESRDITNIYSATKFGYDNSLPIATTIGANYQSMAYTGFEDLAQSPIFGGEVFLPQQHGASVVNGTVANPVHTGEKMLAVVSNAWQTIYKAAAYDDGAIKGLATGCTYRISIWKEATSDGGLMVETGGNSFMASSTGINSDGWDLMTVNVNVPAGASDLSVKVRSNSGTCWFDDFRVHPVDASMSTYVYDRQTQQLRFTLDNENFYTEYQYDEQGRLVSVWKETASGKKKANSFLYHYSRQ